MPAAAPSIDSLRARIRAMERLKPPPPDDVEVHPAVTRRIAPACLHQILGEPGPATALAAGIAGRLAVRLSRPVLWVAGGDDLHPPGLSAFGLPPGAVIVAAARDATDALWSMEEGLKSATLACVVGEAAALDMTAGRRLQLAAESGATTGLLLHPPGARAANAGTTRWRVAGLPGDRWRLALERGRDGPPGQWEVPI
ncbi:MAG: hypothetical protein AB1918_04625 [Pseudomonadota bacterium]